MFFRLLRQSFLQGYSRKALMSLTVALMATLITALCALSVDVGDKMAMEMKSYGSNIRVTPKSETMPLVIDGIDYNPLKGSGDLDEADLPKIKDIFWRNNIVGLAPRLALSVTVAGDVTDGSAEASLIGTYFDHPVPLPDDPAYRTGVRTINPFWHVEGAWPDEESAGEVLVGQELARRLDVAPGDALQLHDPSRAAGPPRSVIVSGILVTGGDEDRALVGPLALVQDMAGRNGRMQSVDVSALTVAENDLSRKASSGSDELTPEEYDVWYCTAYVSAIAHQIEEAIPGVSARPIWQVASGEGAVIGRIQTLLLVVSMAAIAAAAMAVAALTGTTVGERAAEIGLMKALGADPLEIHLLFMAEAAVIGMIGGLVGLLAGFGVTQGIGWSVFGVGVDVRPIIVPVVLTVSVATVLIGSIPPARAISALLPVEVLHGRR